jgi:hypothetical protein
LVVRKALIVVLSWPTGTRGEWRRGTSHQAASKFSPSTRPRSGLRAKLRIVSEMPSPRLMGQVQGPSQPALLVWA